MTSFLLKIVMNPLALWLSAFIFEGLFFDDWTQIFVLGLVLAVVGILLELLLLKRGTLWLSTILDGIASTLLVFVVTPMFDNAGATLTASLLTGLLFMLVEYFLHRFLLSAGLTRKGERA